jgi:excisionase family DNA binding protein
LSNVAVEEKGDRSAAPRGSIPMPDVDDEVWLTSSELAALLSVSPKTIARWAKAGQLPFRRTLGGHRRYPKRAVLARIVYQDAALPAHPDLRPEDTPEA